MFAPGDPHQEHARTRSHDALEGDGTFDEPSAENVIDPTIVMMKRPSRGLSPLLLPPFLVVLLGGLFLTYRANADDWHGFSLDRLVAWAMPESIPIFVPKPEPAPSPAPIVIPKTEVASNETRAKRTIPEVPIVPEEKLVAPVQEKAEVAEIDPLEDIRREAQKTKERIAELEKLKNEESRKLAANERERKNERGMDPRRVPPEEIRRMIAAQQRRFDRQLAQFEALKRGRNVGPGFGGVDPDGFHALARQRMKEFQDRWGVGGALGANPNANLFMGIPENAEGFQTEFQEFRGDGGSHTIVIRKQFRTSNKLRIDPKPGEIPPPPPAPDIPEVH